MGIPGQNKLLYTSEEIKDCKLIFRIVSEFYKAKIDAGIENFERKRPKVVIDGNIIGYDFIYKKIGPARGVLHVALAFINAGIDVCIVCDHKDKRHHSKRATIERKGERERIDSTTGDENRIDNSAAISR